MRARRPPPPFQPARVVSVVEWSPRLVALRLAGDGLGAMVPEQPAASVRLLLPEPGADELVLPTWTGNEFLAEDGSRPPIRTVTPLVPTDAGADLEVAVVLHGDSPLSVWARAAEPGTPVAVSGPGRGHEIDQGASRYVLAGDETALPAISQLLGRLPETIEVDVLVEVAETSARVELTDHPGARARWLEPASGEPVGASLVPAVAGLDLAADAAVHVWAAGEAAVVQRIRRHLFDEVGLERSATTVRGYWKVGRAEQG